MAMSLLYGSGVQAQEGIPALLQFAEQYRDNQSTTSIEPTPPKKVKPQKEEQTVVRPPGVKGEVLSLRQALQAREAHLNRQQAAMRDMQKEIATLRQAQQQALKQAQAATGKKTVAKPDALPDLTPLKQLVSGFRQAASGLPDQQRMTELVQDVAAQRKQDQNALGESQAQVRALKRQLSEMQKHLQSGGDEKKLAQQSHRELEAHMAGLQSQLAQKNQSKEQLQRHLETETAQRKSLEGRLTVLQLAQHEQQTLAENKLSEQAAAQVSVSNKMQARIGELEEESKRLQKAHEQERLRNNILETEIETLTKTREDLQQQVSEADIRLATQDRELLLLKEDMQHLRDRAKLLASVDSLKAAPRRQAYAAGTALGRDILDMVEEYKSWGLKTDQKTILAGIVDAFTGQYQLTTDVLAHALADSEKEINQARDKVSVAQQKKGEAFIVAFKKKRGVKKSPSGFWYQIDYAGDEPIGADAIVDLVVKESLADGTVIQDMDIASNVLSQPLGDFPPLFREAIGHLRNHGTMIMVVPPELAYGEAGYPPKVPPNATMVYELRVADSKPL
ncbi:FKBP-type peptidyl-prolyl cis-trans isomerase N-terminal domain-containing protein [Serratia liquefaciens]|uniref:FKBP-type peptidyl-prolyl cis-trans isomerase N-terminal domain-containing protein n=1 Tax=Serratia liquefaciens TaxID=614 RepID=UPI00236300FE|nr:FKBP-type peptidyl-prolyl cis-trans isomerase N-terminal domain-containing protein [Serratia liquefaciens]